MNERLTWNQIRQKYPDSWVKLINVEWETENHATVQSAVVDHVGSPTEQDFADAFDHNGYILFTTPENHLTMGTMML